MQKLFTIPLLALAVLAQAPADFAVVQATSKQVQLSWTGGQPSYTVERKPLGGDFAALPLNTDPSVNSYTDTSIAPYETYTYRVRARLSPNTLSDPSAEFTVGPPPVGFSVASPLAPAVTNYALTTNSNFGTRLRVALDSNGDPALAYLVYSPQEDPGKSIIEFVSWNRVTYRWNDPRKVVQSGDALGSGPSNKSVALARDPASNTWGVAYLSYGGGGPRLALSRDNGETWADSRALDCGEASCSQAALAMGDGKFHLATLKAPEGVQYITGGVTDAPADWKSQVVPMPAGGLEALQSLDIAVDSANQPALAFWSNTDSYNLILGYWRPGQNTISAMDTAGFQTDAPDVELKFFGTSARVLAVARRTEEYFSRYDQNLWVVRDQGGVFSMPSNLPSDGEAALDYPSLAVGSAGQLSVAVTEVGGTGEGVRCGNMKLIESSEDGANWTVCSPIARDAQPFYDVNYPRIVYAPHDGRYIAFTNTGADSQLPGVVVWRER